MAIEFRCSQCNKLLRVEDHAAGKRAKCPQCGATMVIPAASVPTGGPAPPPDFISSPAPDFAPSPPPQASATAWGSPGASGGAGWSAAPPRPGLIDIGDILGRTWEVFSTQIGTLILLGLIWVGVIAASIVAVYGASGLMMAITRSGLVFQLALFLGLLGAFLLIAAVAHGELRAVLKIARGQPATVAEVFSFGPTLVPFVLTCLVYGILAAVGAMLCYVPGLIAVALLNQSLFLVIDRNMNVGEALFTSKDLAMSNLLMLCVVWLLAGLALGLVNACTCHLGTIATAPFGFLMGAVIYQTLTGERSPTGQTPIR